MKSYIKPAISEEYIQLATTILAGSGGVETGNSVGNKFNSSDVTYSRGGSDSWDDED